ncbi:MAG: hydroxymethylbilane synthase, partial [Deltaproteobacteria bacterium]
MKLRVGTRRSKLARTQSGQTCALIERHAAGLQCELVPIETTGDQVRDRPLREAGGKGLFVKELDEALLDGRVDCAVHSLKDVPTQLPEGIVIAAIPSREDPRDLLVTRDGRGPRELAGGSVLGTTSARRAAQLLAIDESLKVALLRGNVETRLRRLIDGDFDATFPCGGRHSATRHRFVPREIGGPRPVRFRAGARTRGPVCDGAGGRPAYDRHPLGHRGPCGASCRRGRTGACPRARRKLLSSRRSVRPHRR